MDTAKKATSINLFSLKTPQMRAFHLTWFAFFLCFFGWFGIAPLMAVVREEFALSKTQIGNIIIASVAITIVARLFIGWLLDRIGPRLAYSGLLVMGAVPVMGIGLAQSYEAFLMARLAIGVIGASFVITQYHTSLMFAPNCVGAANATTAGWGNLGGGVTQMVMPLIFAAVLSFGADQFLGWRLAMVVPGIAMLITGVLYYFFTQDTPQGNYKELRARGEMEPVHHTKGSFLAAICDARVWSLFVIYAACFGIELTINNIAALYFHDHFTLDLKTAGLIAGLFGLMNLFARSLGGILSDKFNVKGGLKGRVTFMGVVLLCEGMALVLFSRMEILALAVVTLIVFSLFVQMAEGATYAVVPFVNKKALGSVAGIVGAGGNAGAVAAGFLFRAENISTNQGLLILGCLVACSSVCAFLVRFSEADQTAVDEEMASLSEKKAMALTA